MPVDTPKVLAAAAFESGYREKSRSMIEPSPKMALPMVLALATALVTACTPTSRGGPWVTTYGRDHELVGTIVDVRRQQAVSEAELAARLAEADVVLLGEKHDNEDHHRLQAHVVDLLAPEVDALVFEMMTLDQQQLIVEYLAAKPGDTEGLGPALRWSESGWPDWRMYKPIADAALAQGAQIVAGNIDRSTGERLMNEGIGSLSESVVQRLGLAQPLPTPYEEELVRELSESHCGYAPRDRLAGMLLVQRSRDAMMADRLAALTGDGTSVLVAGAGHVRNDWGVPLYLHELLPDKRVVSLAFLEVIGKDETLPVDLPYDYVWFTPRVQPVGYDPCAAFRNSLQQMEARAPGDARTSATRSGA
ncbi:MAG: ChaN family lipoprotein [Geminicoccaceae bacterium]|nr:ChaN family lipoprotein [Geminicoccaceae bacterium]